MRRVLLGAAMALALAAPAFAQDKETLADVRKELGQLSSQLQSLRSELVASGAKGMQAAGGASALQRMDTMEASISRLTLISRQQQSPHAWQVDSHSSSTGSCERNSLRAYPAAQSIGVDMPQIKKAGIASAKATGTGPGRT